MRLNLTSFGLLTCLLGVAQAATTANAILDSIAKINNEIITVNNTLNTVNGSLISIATGLKIESEAQTLLGDLNNATAITNATSTLNQTGSVDVGFALSGLQPYVFDVLDNFVAHHQQFANAGFAGLARASLVSLQNATDELAKSITANLIPEIRNVSPLITSNIDYHFGRVLQVYS